MLRKVRKHNVLISLVLDKDVASWLNNIANQRAKWSHQSVSSDFLVAKGSAFCARVAEHAGPLFGLVRDKVPFTFDDLQLGEDSKLESIISGECKREMSTRRSQSEHRRRQKIMRETYLHRCTGLLSAEATVAPACQGWVTSDLSFEISAHARPSSFRHVDRCCFLIPVCWFVVMVVTSVLVVF